MVEYFNETLLISKSKAEWFPKDHVTLKTGVMTQKRKSAFNHRNILHFLKYIEIENNILNCNNISDFYSMFDQTNTALVSIRDSF